MPAYGAQGELRRTPLGRSWTDRVADRQGSGDDGHDMPRLKIAELLANVPADPEAHLDPARVELYARTLDVLPPVVVFEIPEGLLLADGYHRVAAARRRGLETVEAEVRSGSRHDALRYAAREGASQRGISLEEAASYIERYAHDCRTSEH